MEDVGLGNSNTEGMSRGRRSTEQTWWADGRPEESNVLEAKSRAFQEVVIGPPCEGNSSNSENYTNASARC